MIHDNVRSWVDAMIEHRNSTGQKGRMHDQFVDRPEPFGRPAYLCIACVSCRFTTELYTRASPRYQERETAWRDEWIAKLLAASPLPPEVLVHNPPRPAIEPALEWNDDASIGVLDSYRDILKGTDLILQLKAHPHRHWITTRINPKILRFHCMDCHNGFQGPLEQWAVTPYDKTLQEFMDVEILAMRKNIEKFVSDEKPMALRNWANRMSVSSSIVTPIEANTAWTKILGGDSF